MAPVKYHYGKFPPKKLNWERLIPLIGPASRAVAKYDALLSTMPNPDLLLSPLVTQEAVLSSRIEGTQASMKDVLGFEAGERIESEEKRRDIHEILNYRSAMVEAEKKLKKLPLSTRVIKEIHKTLLKGVRGENKLRGEFRKVPNWIGPSGSTIETAKFIPITADKLPEALSRWEKFIHKDFADVLVQLAIVHVEFEALHPFLDGNGRIGRILVPLFLWQKGVICAPRFYISAYFEAHREEYYERLLLVSKKDDWTGWCEFFLEAIKGQAEENFAKANSILKLYRNMEIRVPELTGSKYAGHALRLLFVKPVFMSSDFSKNAKIPPATGRRILNVLVDSKIVQVIKEGRGRRATVYYFKELLDIAG